MNISKLRPSGGDTYRENYFRIMIVTTYFKVIKIAERLLKYVLYNYHNQVWMSLYKFSIPYEYQNSYKNIELSQEFLLSVQTRKVYRILLSS